VRKLAFFICLLASLHCAGQQPFAVLIHGGNVYDGRGGAPFKADIGIRGDTIAAIGELSGSPSDIAIDARGLAVAPGFINMLSWADASLIKDGRSLSDLKQGVTLEVFGEGISAGPRMRAPNDKRWKTLGQYFTTLEKKGVSVNFASFVGATTVREYVLDKANRAPSPTELEKMKGLVRDAMREGAMGLGSSLIYAPADYASTEELVALSKEASRYGGMYITHMRSESDHILKALDEAIRIGSEAKVPVEIYHLKINHQRNWNKIDTLLARIDSARKAGLKITANMYTYTASGTGLTARLPTWVQEGGLQEMRKRLKTSSVRARVLEELRLGIPTKNSDPKDVLVMSFHKDSLNQLYKGKRLDEIARLHGKDADETVLDLIIADRSSIPCIFFLMSEDNLRKILRQPYVSFCSDGYSIPAEPPWSDTQTHPRVYGSFARLLGRYVRDEKIISMEEAIRRLTSMPAANLKISKRGSLSAGYFADVVVFDPATIRDKATFEDSHQYAEGMVHVFVNGKQVLKDGNHTGLMPGRAVRGPGWQGKP
jgi:N-acyl-D-amino-acid deacylase